jgi:hypothetical protein
VFVFACLPAAPLPQALDALPAAVLMSLMREMKELAEKPAEGIRVRGARPARFAQEL